MSRLRIVCKGTPLEPEASARKVLEEIARIVDGDEDGDTVDRVVDMARRCLNPPPSKYPVINGCAAGYTDVFLTAVGDDGTEVPLYNVLSIDWRVAQGNEPATATIVFDCVDVDVEAVIDNWYAVNGPKPKAPA